MLDNKFVSIDNIYHRQISEGCILCIYGDYYPSSYWYVYEKDRNNLLTIIQLNNYYKPMTNPSKILKLKAKDIDYMIISNPKSKINLLKIEVDIPIEFFKNYHQNRLNTKLPKYGDLLLIEQNFFSYGSFFVLNYEPHNYTYLIYNIITGKTENIFMELCKYKTISTKELRRQIYDKSEKIRIKHTNTDYEILNQIDERIYFQTKMNYMFDSGMNNACLGLIQLGFLDEPLINLSGKINQELNNIEEKNNELLGFLQNYESISEEYNDEPCFENICDVNENIKNLITNDEAFINTYLNEYKYSEINQITEEEQSISNYDVNKSSSEGDTIDYPECSYDEKYNNYIEDSYDSEQKYDDEDFEDNYDQQMYNEEDYDQQKYKNEESDDSYEQQNYKNEESDDSYEQQNYKNEESDDSYEQQNYKNEESEDSYYGPKKYIENIYENDIDQKYNENSNDSYVSYLEQQYITNAFDSYEEEKYVEKSYHSYENKINNNSYDDQLEKENYENNLDSKVDELYNYFNTIERKLVIDEQIIDTKCEVEKLISNDYNEMPALIEINNYDFNNIINSLVNDVLIKTENCIFKEDKEIEELTNLFNNCKLINNDEIITNNSSPIKIESDQEIIINNPIILEETNIIIETETIEVDNEQQHAETFDDYVTITRDEIEPISRESCSVM
jgi:hypothetical protein